MMHERPWATAGPRDRPGGGVCCLRRHSGRTQPCRPAALARHWRLTRAPCATWTLRCACSHSWIGRPPSASAEGRKTPASPGLSDRVASLCSHDCSSSRAIASRMTSIATAYRRKHERARRTPVELNVRLVPAPSTSTPCSCGQGIVASVGVDSKELDCTVPSRRPTAKASPSPSTRLPHPRGQRRPQDNRRTTHPLTKLHRSRRAVACAVARAAPVAGRERAGEGSVGAEEDRS